MKHIIVSQTMKHLEDQNILSDRQFGFRSKHSCESQLFITINDIAKQIDTNLQVDAAILDFLKLLIKYLTQDSGADLGGGLWGLKPPLHF